ncbi:NACHT, LRR and PYD domains-containing protein 12-like [Brienomyrus brachyistius]|uniref:NACHT, LRR and PYD domains-containing protein 12-like n=1 Tax=Brienomyrus brachyistius TaxID=42636 RepID=UPI0020B22768|nr:NACHT, LRR and PYD domains-containing protein 12-like [Brienomyrus brachyistius]
MGGAASEMTPPADCKTKRTESVLMERAGSPVPSWVSMKSDRSMDRPISFREGPFPTDQSVLMERAGSPVPSWVSMKSDRSMDRPISFREGPFPTDQSVLMERAGSPVPSSVSMKNDRSMDRPIGFREGPFLTDQRGSSRSHRVCVGTRMEGDASEMTPPAECKTKEIVRVLLERAGSRVPRCVSMKSNMSMVEPISFREGSFPSDQRDQVIRCNSHPHKGDLSSIFKLLEEKAQMFLKDELMKFKRYLDENDPECSEPQLEEDNDLDSDGQMQKTCGREGALKITLYILRTMEQNDLVDMLEKRHLLLQCQRRIKCNLKKKFECVFEEKAKEGQPTLLKEIYTELYITEGGAGGVNDEHEVRQTETASRKRLTEDTTVKCNDIFKPLYGRVTPIRTVLTKGVAGIGKTVSVQKVILDWAEGKANQDIRFIFALPFRDLNLIKDEYSLIDLLHHFVPELKLLESTELFRYKVLLIFDGLDECRLPLDFQNNESWFDVTKKTSLDVLLTNLIKGNLLPSALLWITSRPAAANQIPPECVHQVTEIRGFSDAQKEEYFRKRFSDQSLANMIITNVKSSRSLFIMCHIPAFCWISATVLERLFSETEKGEIPRTLTEMYTHFLIFHVRLQNEKYMKNYESMLKEYSKKFLLKLGKLAFDNLEKGNLIFYKQDLTENGVDVTEASVYSGVCTEVFKEEYGLCQEKVYCFVHLSIQEYLAALYVFLSNSSAELLKTAVAEALKSKNGHLDLYLRFLLGLSTDSSKTLLQKLLGQTRTSSYNSKKTAQYIKEKIQENLSAERTINLFHCLNELGDNSLIEEVQRSLSSGSLSAADLSPGQWSALAFVLLMSDKELDVFDLKKYIRSDEGLQRLLPVIKKSRTALLDSCRLTETCCEVLASALRSNSSQLRELDLSDNDLQDSGVKLLSAGLGDSHCTLETLRLSGCRVTEEGCSSLASALRTNPSHLRELDLSYNHPGDSGVKLLFGLLEDPSCKLEKLKLSGCRVTEGGCSSLASALRSNSSQLTELDLRDNDLQDSGVKLLSAGLGDSHCKLEILRLSGCRVTEGGCSSLASALRSNSSQLTELDLSDNDLQDSGVKLLSAGLGNSHCTLEILRLSFCRVTEEGCSSLASALRSNPSHLRELDLSYNHPGDSGVKLLSALLEDPSCKLEKLNVDHSGECRTRPGIQKYSCQLTLDPNTANRRLSLSEGNRKVTQGAEQPYPVHQERFDYWPQVLCRESLTGRCYWEAEWSGDVAWIGVTYKGIGRKGGSDDCRLGANDKSWMLFCSSDSYSVWHNNKQTVIPIEPSDSRRVGVYLDRAAGTLSFYRVSSDGLTLLYSFTSSFTEPLYPGFWVYNPNSSVSLCMLG